MTGGREMTQALRRRPRSAAWPLLAACCWARAGAEENHGISCGKQITCGVLADGFGFCWGAKLEGGPSEDLAAISVNENHACAIRAGTKTAVCWGTNDYPQAVEAPAGVAMSAITVGTYFSCGLRADNQRAVCWGNTELAAAPSDEIFSAIAAGFLKTCGLREATGFAVCWGLGAAGGVNANEVALDVIAVGSQHQCGLRRGSLEVFCWGIDSDGQVNDAPAGVAMRAIAAGGFFSCAIRADSGAAVCWGKDTDGVVSQAPVGVALAAISAGWDHACGIRADTQRVVCWGGDAEKQSSGAPPDAAFLLGTTTTTTSTVTSTTATATSTTVTTSTATTTTTTATEVVSPRIVVSIMDGKFAFHQEDFVGVIIAVVVGAAAVVSCVAEPCSAPKPKAKKLVASSRSNVVPHGKHSRPGPNGKAKAGCSARE